MTKNTGYYQKQRDIKEKLKDFGEIYLATCITTGKKYIGQAVLFSGTGLRPYGTEKRWKCHLSEARTHKPTCRVLNFAINKYGPDDFIVIPLLSCKLDKINDYEIEFIKHYNTLVPHGYNLQEGGKSGRASEETKELMRIRMTGENHPQFGIKLSDETKEKIRQTNINNAIRMDKDGVTVLPKYMKYVKWASEEGYHIIAHPLCKSKKFTSTSRITEEIINQRKIEALLFLANLNA